MYIIIKNFINLFLIKPRIYPKSESKKKETPSRIGLKTIKKSD